MPIRHPVGGVGTGPLILAPKSVFNELVGAMPVAAVQTPALKLANQLKYSEPSYSYNGEAPPKFYGYSGTGYGNEQTKGAMSSFSPPLFVVPGSTPTQKVTLVNAAGEPEAPGARENTQSGWEAVPVPIIAKVPSGSLVDGGTDKHLCVWRPSTDEWWEFWVFLGSEGAYTSRAGGYHAEVSKWTGIFSQPEWGARAYNLMTLGGSITQQDLVEVLEGKEIKHALSVAVVGSLGTPVLPASRADTSSNTVEKHGGEANPAFGNVDSISGEGMQFRLPPASTNPYNHTLEPLAWAVNEASRKYGVIVADSGGVCQFFVECPISSGSPYAFNVYSPLIGSTSNFLKQPSYVPESMKKPGLPALTENNAGANNAFSKQPWQELELLEPRAS